MKAIQKILDRYNKMYTATIYGSVADAREQKDKDFDELVKLVEKLSKAPVSKRYYWLKPDGTISNMWDEETHIKYLTKKEIEDAKKKGWHVVQINVC